MVLRGADPPRQYSYVWRRGLMTWKISIRAPSKSEAVCLYKQHSNNNNNNNNNNMKLWQFFLLLSFISLISISVSDDALSHLPEGLPWPIVITDCIIEIFSTSSPGEVVSWYRSLNVLVWSPNVRNFSSEHSQHVRMLFHTHLSTL